MDELGKVTLATLSLFGKEISYDPMTFKMTYLVMAVLLIFSIIGSRHLRKVPGKIQNILELIYEFLSEITLSTLGEKDGKRYVPFVVTLFMFILAANWIGIFPNILRFVGTLIALVHQFFSGSAEFVYTGLTSMSVVVPETAWYSSLLQSHGIEEPTKSVNTDLAIAILVFILCQSYGIKNKGIYHYIRDFADDPFPMKGPLIIFFFLNPFFYLNVIGLFANVVSHSFRLFGNIFGGGMIIVIVSSLLNYFLVPVGLFAFFGLFAGLVQAFVFTMLAVTYLQQQQP
jgi:F-type H+-transporting ATPase subunit a